MAYHDIKTPWKGWRVVNRIGKGGFGTVYEIERSQYGIQERAAMKVITIPQSADEIDDLVIEGYDDNSITQRFISYAEDIVKEYYMMVQMKGNANIVYCDDYQVIPQDNGFGRDIYIRMELLTPLMKALDQVSDESQIVRFGIDMCNALEVCERRKVLHRDIKPQNIFLSNDGVFKLGDFGIARTAEKTTRATVGKGTYQFMAPEVKNEQPYGSTVDIYSLGLVMYWLLNNRRSPFLPLPPAVPTHSEEQEALRRRFSGEQIPAPKNGSNELKAIVLKACAFDPKERYQSAREMREALQYLCGNTIPIPDSNTVPVLDSRSIQDSGIENDSTVGPVFKRQTHMVEVELEPTVGPVFAKKADQSQVRTEKQHNNGTSDKSDNGSGKKKKKVGLIAALCAIIAVILLLLQQCGGDSRPAPGEWSEWMDAIPSYVTAEDYLIEEQVLYRSRTWETTESTTENEMPGWELYRTASGGEDFGDWSDWSDTEVVGSDTREVESELRYRYRDKETTTDSSSSKSGWTLYDTTYTWGEYGNWSKWSPSIVTSSDSRKVETKTQYSYRDKEFTTSSSSSLDGWILYDTTYGEWGNAQTTTTKPTESDTLQITATTQTGWGYHHWCNQYYDGSWGVDSKAVEGIQNHWHSYTSSIPLPAVSIADHGGSQAYGGTGSGAQPCGYGFYIWFRNGGADTYSYTYETRTVTYHFYRYPDKWSSWSDTPVTANSDREVKTQTLYRYKDRTQVPTYHFWKWGEWSDWEATAVSGPDSREVETATFYRYRDIVEETVYYFRRWTEWSEYTNVEIAETDNVEVEEKTQYRYKLK